MTKPLVSIGVPVYNAQNFLEKALTSLVGQTYRDLEIIISDNASTDGTEEICRRFAAADPRIRYSRNAVNVGAGPNYNRVFALATGKYFKWAAHDDLCAPTFVERCVEALEADPNVVLAFPRMVDIDEHDVELPAKPEDFPRAERGAFAATHLRFRYLIRLGYTCEEVFGVIRSDILRRTRLIQSYTDSDRTLLAELALYGRLVEVPEVLFLHRVHRGMSTQAFTDWTARTAWFDPAKAGKRVFPMWRQLGEYVLAVVRSAAPFSDKLRCVLYLANWCRRHRDHLVEELSAAFRKSRTA